MDNDKVLLDLMNRVSDLEDKLDSLTKLLEKALLDKEESNEMIQEDCNRFVVKNSCFSLSSKSMNQVEKIANYISAAIDEAIEQGLHSISIRSGDVHRALQLQNRIPSVCNGMRKVISIDKRIKDAVVTRDTPSHNSSTYTIRYEF